MDGGRSLMGPRILSRYIVVALVALLPSPQLGAAWEASDKKPVAELMLMTSQELLDEARGPCYLGIAWLKTRNPYLLDTAKNGFSYIQTIGLVARKNNGGKDPEWLEAVNKAIHEQDEERCLKITVRPLQPSKGGKEKHK
jgi:hypothetical protein